MHDGLIRQVAVESPRPRPVACRGLLEAEIGFIVSIDLDFYFAV